jgi:hypothetical protein
VLTENECDWRIIVEFAFICEDFNEATGREVCVVVAIPVCKSYSFVRVGRFFGTCVGSGEPPSRREFTIEITRKCSAGEFGR